MVAPAAGGRVDGVTTAFGITDPGPPALTNFGYNATPGNIHSVEAAGAFAAGVLLETTNDGRVIQQSTGRVVLRALQASAGAGSFVWATFTS